MPVWRDTRQAAKAADKNAKAAAEPAEKRLALIETLSERLGPQDAPFLESLAADRSGYVRALAERLLAGDIPDGTTVEIDEGDGQLTFVMH